MRSARQEGRFVDDILERTVRCSFTLFLILGLILYPYGFIRSQRSREFSSLHLAVVRQHGHFPLPWFPFR